MRATLAELAGTFALTFTVISLHSSGFPVPAPVVVAVALGLLVYVLGPVSGCYINPAITIGVLLIKRIGLREAGIFLVAQFAGAGLALAAGNAYFPESVSLTADSAGATGVAEALGSAMLGFAVAGVVIQRVPSYLSGAVIGMGLLVGISWAAPQSHAILNPAVALGVGSLSFAYIWGPIVGAVAGAATANLLAKPDDD